MLKVQSQWQKQSSEAMGTIFNLPVSGQDTLPLSCSDDDVCYQADFIGVHINPAFPSAETVQELQRAFLRELRAQRAAAALVHPAGDGVHLLLLPAAAAVRLHAHMKALARLAHGKKRAIDL